MDDPLKLRHGAFAAIMRDLVNSSLTRPLFYADYAAFQRAVDERRLLTSADRAFLRSLHIVPSLDADA